VKTGTIRLVHRDAGIRRRWRAALNHFDANVLESAGLNELTCQDREVLVIGDPGGGARGALALIRNLRRAGCAVVLIVAAGDSSEDLAIDALELGVNAYLREPLTTKALADAVGRWVDRVPPTCARSVGSELGLIGESEQIRHVRDLIGLAARVDSTVLVTGESGTGKELTARTLHQTSLRQGRLLTLNCAAIPDALLESELFGYERGAFTGAYRSEAGKLAQADGGTLFLDEIGELSAGGQAKILRVIETKELQRLGSRKPASVNVRIVAATNRCLEDLVTEGRFREDLYYRLNVVQIHMAPLRERIGDLPLLALHCLNELNSRFHQRVTAIDECVQHRMAAYRWPGNVRELRNMLEATCVGVPGAVIRFEHLPELYQRRMTELAEAPGAMSERHRLLNALNATQWNKSRAAEQLHWSRVTLYRKLAKYGIPDPTDDRKGDDSDAKHKAKAAGTSE